MQPDTHLKKIERKNKGQKEGKILSVNDPYSSRPSKRSEHKKQIIRMDDRGALLERQGGKKATRQDFKLRAMR